jgi:pilus assembly protein Flp/PilA
VTKPVQPPSSYGLIAAGISVAIIATVAGLGSKLNTTFTSVQNAMN